MMGSCEHGNESSGCIKFMQFLEHLSDCHFLKKASTPWSYLVLYSVTVMFVGLMARYRDKN
jgi:hypothetical protein